MGSASYNPPMYVMCLALAAALAQQPAAPPQPFPRPATPVRPGTQPNVQPAPPPDVPAVSTPTTERGPSETVLGVPIYPGAQFLTSFDAGRGQRFYWYGSTASFIDLVTFYRTVLKQKGEMVFDAPGTYEFEVGKYREETMAFPSGVTIKDFQSQMSQGYPNPKPGGQPGRFPTVIQIVPVIER